MAVKEPEVMKAKHWVYGKGTNPSRIVLMKKFKPDGTIREYCTHMQVDNKGTMEYYHGHYFETLAAAKADYEKRKA